MIRRRDHLRLSLQKLALRKRRAAFAIILVALAVIGPVTVSSLVRGVRQVLTQTRWTEDLDPRVIKVVANDNPYDFALTEEQRRAQAKRRWQFLTEEILTEIRGWPGVAAAARTVNVFPVRLDVLANRPQPIQALTGTPEVLLRRYVTDARQWAAVNNAIPLVVGERLLRLHFDPAHKKLVLDPTPALAHWVGRDVTIILGDEYAGLTRYNYDQERREFHPLSAEEIAREREQGEQNFRTQYDPAIHERTLALQGRIVGTYPGDEVLLPQETAALCQKWLEQRNRLASLHPEPAGAAAVAYDARGRRTPRPEEFTEAIVVAKPGANVEVLAKRLDARGFYATTRDRTFANQARAFDSGLRVVKKVAWAFGVVMLLLACGLVWSTTAKIVSDSRADIGLFRALGATKRDVRRLFLGEAMGLGIVGTLAGISLGWLLAAGISRWVVKFAGGNLFDPEEALFLPSSIFAIDAIFCLLLVLLAAAVSFLAGFWPATRAANIDPVKALKRE